MITYQIGLFFLFREFLHNESFILVLWVLLSGRDALWMCLEKDLGFMSPLYNWTSWHLEWATQVTADVPSVQRKFVSILRLSAPKIPPKLEVTVVIYFGGFSNLYPNHLMETQVTTGTLVPVQELLLSVTGYSCLPQIQMLSAWVACE